MAIRQALAIMLATFFCASLQAAAPVGGFMVHLNQQNVSGFGDSRRSVTFYDTSDLTAGPLFSVHVPGEFFDVGAYNGEEVDAIAADPTTGDVYVLAFDSGLPDDPIETNPGTGADDTPGDFDLYRINFQAAYDHWSETFEGNVASSIAGVGGSAPLVPDGCGAGCTFDDYVTYGVGPVDGIGAFNPADAAAHGNAFVLPGVVEKIGEVKRNSGGNFFDFSLEFVDSNTLVMIDDSSEPTENDSAANDHAYRIIERVSGNPGEATGTTLDHGDGGFNNGTTESWTSRSIGLVNQDFASGAPNGHSEPESMAFYADPLTGVRGFWVTESDSSAETRSDDVAFYEIDADGNGVGYREHNVGGGPDFPTAFALDNDPFVDSSLNDGQADHIFVDEDTGDLIIIESGFGDSGIDTVGADHEPGVIRREVVSYDDGTGRIQFGAWSEKKILDPAKDPGDTFLERGHWAAYNSEEDTVYFLSPGGGGETPSFQFDLHALDITTGVTTSVLNIDDSVSLFFGDSFGDVADYFFVSDDSGVVPGDLNGDGEVNFGDLQPFAVALTNPDDFATLFPNGDIDACDVNGDGGCNFGDLQPFSNLFANGAAAGSAAVPEPGTLLLGLLAAAGLSGRRRQ